MKATLLSLMAAALIIWSMITIANSNLDPNKKVLWFAIVLLVPILGSLVYFFFQVQKNSD